MSAPLRFDTVRVGSLSVSLGGHDLAIDTRLVRGSDSLYRVLFAGTLSDPFATLDEAAARAEAPEPRPPDASCTMHWRADVASLAPGEHACPICGAPASGAPRYPRNLCPACTLEATDTSGRPVRFFNVDATGGFVARHADDGTPATADCLVRGVRCHAEERYFGGIVVRPIA